VNNLELIRQHFASADIEPSDITVTGTTYTAVYNPDNPAYERGDLEEIVANALKGYGMFRMADVPMKTAQSARDARLIAFQFDEQPRA
jgi:hypothetical protein